MKRERIIADVLAGTPFTVEDMIGPGRGRPIVGLRWRLVHRLTYELRWPVARTARFLCKDRTTIRHALAQSPDRIEDLSRCPKVVAQEHYRKRVGYSVEEGRERVLKALRAGFRNYVQRRRDERGWFLS